MTDDAEAAFSAVADELRVRILRELWDADDPLSFSELRERVDVQDSGRFNYHLGELRGLFVEQTEDGYDLRFAGRKLVGSLHSGVYTETGGMVGPQSVDGTCVLCGSDLEAVYEDQVGKVDCTDCEVTIIQTGVPPAFVDGREDDLAAAIDGYVRTTSRSLLDGFCPTCSGPTAGHLAENDYGPQAVVNCERCGISFSGLAAWVAVDHPAVLSFYDDHDRSVRDTPLWHLDWLADAEWVDGAAGDRATVEVRLDDERLRVTVTDDLAVTAVDRAQTD
ncbi:helix-turn-helix domain-containing protein [Halobacterium salinarum]|uniref:ArsR/SmtB family transcription factor n=1 Tax=Halobacterium salinarum TaxID=2242 RepID=UPI002556A88F|nr:helix-turn-helix domain-containing protein [Halobacterium salinarum]MDL0124366.1 helix-turn-helix domain-containing protein [Halobacterium salinarum]